MATLRRAKSKPMKKVAIVFVLAVFVPSLVLAWLAVRSLRNQQFVVERQRALLYQGITDTLAQQAETMLADQQHEFSAQVEALLAGHSAADVAASFDEELQTNWPLARIGFVVTSDGRILCPSPKGGANARAFLSDNSKFLANRESAEVYWNAPKQLAQLASDSLAQPSVSKEMQPKLKTQNSPQFISSDQTESPTPPTVAEKDELLHRADLRIASESAPQAYRNVSPQNSFAGQKPVNLDKLAAQYAPREEQATPATRQQTLSAPARSSPVARAVSSRLYQPAPQPAAPQFQQQLSKSIPAEAEFRQLIGNANEGSLARFVDNKLSVLFWYRSAREPQYIFGTEVSLPKLISRLGALTQTLEPPLTSEICVVLLDDAAKPVALSKAAFHANWKRPFVATEIGESLPHWEIAAYLLDPGLLNQAANTARLTLGLLIVVLVLAIGIGSWLIVSDLNRQLRLAQQKADFVSSVSHELKTPLTSIRMFSELIAEDRVRDSEKQRSYLNIITAEAARLTRLINNVLDFSRIERGEKKYHFQECDLAKITRDTAESYLPHLEANGFQLKCDLPEKSLPVRGDADALAQIIVNLLSNAEKYSGDQKDIVVEASRRTGPLAFAEVRVLDRGPGVPRDSDEKIFEKFYRTHDSLNSGIQGSGLGLTLARQIARAHGGDVSYQPRKGGGSCFCLRLPLVASERQGETSEIMK